MFCRVHHSIISRDWSLSRLHNKRIFAHKESQKKCAFIAGVKAPLAALAPDDHLFCLDH